MKSPEFDSSGRPSVLKIANFIGSYLVGVLQFVWVEAKISLVNNHEIKKQNFRNCFMIKFCGDNTSGISKWKPFIFPSQLKHYNLQKKKYSRVLFIVRLLSPSVNGALFSWSLSNVKGAGNADALGFPFNQYFPFFVLSLFALFTVAFGMFFPKSLDNQYQAPSSGDNAVDKDIENNDKVVQRCSDQLITEKKITNFSMRYTKSVSYTHLTLPTKA